MAPLTALPGYTEHGTLSLDGAGSVTIAVTDTTIDPITGVPVVTPANGVITYTVDAYGAVLGTAGNGRLILSANGEYGLYELHAGGTQEWGIVIREHQLTIPFTAMRNSIIYDVHNQGADLHKALNIRSLTADPAVANNVLLTTDKAFAPMQLAPAIICSPMAPTGCFGFGNLTAVMAPVAPNAAMSAANGDFTVLDVTAVGLIPPFASYISGNGDVFWTDDGEAGSIMIGIAR